MGLHSQKNLTSSARRKNKKKFLKQISRSRFIRYINLTMDDVKKDDSNSGNKKRREDKVRRRDSRALDNVLKEVNTLPEPQRFEALQSKYANLYEEYRTSHSSLIVSEKRCATLQTEKNQLQTEQSKLVLARSRMESLCRELQRQNKLIKEESMAKIREEEERRKEVAAKFQLTLNDVMNMMQETTEKNIKLRDDNLDMAGKIESLCKQFEQRKEHQNKIEHQIELEKQLAQAQIDKTKLEFKAEQEIWSHERESLLGKFKKSEETCSQLQHTVKTLQENLEFYSGKYQEFKSSFTKSNQVFDDCKSEMGKMTKQIITLEKEVLMWKQRSQKNAQSVLELCANKQAQESKIDITEKKLEQLQKLCRQLQVDRSSYLKLLKANGIVPTSETNLDEQIIPQTNPEQQLTKKEKHLEQLKDNLKVLQNQLNSIQQITAEETIENLSESTDSSNENLNNAVTDSVSNHADAIQEDNLIESTTALSLENVS
ncbi:hypothetical protein RN001_015711 [Aquatica leii]|uniref:Uncharacterized protein n=1 Tax=Aquatica leii TaxID=1421715 RepID=A0AAN7NWP5_9COLE|nr:hypothetical protein RN001_015711 [Aquatica leii]